MQSPATGRLFVSMMVTPDRHTITAVRLANDQCSEGLACVRTFAGDPWQLFKDR